MQKSNNKGFSIVELLVVLAVVVLLGLIGFLIVYKRGHRQINPQSDRTQQAVNTENIGKVEGLADLKDATTTYFVYPKNWGNFEPLTSAQNYLPRRSAPGLRTSFPSLGEDNQLHIFRLSDTMTFEFGERKCDYDRGTKTWSVNISDNESYVRNYFNGDKEAAKNSTNCDPRSSREQDGVRVDRMLGDGVSVKTNIFELKGTLILIAVSANNKTDIEEQARNDGCCAIPPRYKSGVSERLEASLTAATDVLISLNK